VKLAHVSQVAVFYAPAEDRRIKVGRLALKSRQILFEYDSRFLATKLELSPFKLPLQGGVVTGDPATLDGLMGVFDDSLPDGWGRLLIDRLAVQHGLTAASLTPLDRLVHVGARSMGALVYEPEQPLDEPQIVTLAALAKDVEAVLTNAKVLDLERLIALGGSPKGARPKVLVQIAPNGDLHFGARRIKDDFTAWLVKFPTQTDDRHIASLEHAYFLMARAAGLDVPATQLLGRTTRSPGVFAIERFDRRGSERIHTHTFGGLLQVPPAYSAFDYRDLLQLTRDLTVNEAAVGEMFRRACFNVFAHNRDDHTRNFAFLMDEDGAWSPSPAYDLTFSDGPGGEHTLLVAGEGKNPTAAHLRTLAKELEVKKAPQILEKVRDKVSEFRRFADEAGVPAKLRNSVEPVLAKMTSTPKTSRRGARS
jgi:serine/threonine-protein kinase HipA